MWQISHTIYRWLLTLPVALYALPALAAPIAVDDEIAVPTNTTVFANDISANDTNLSTDAYAIVTPPSNGTATLSSSGLLDYTPNIGFASTDSLTYSIDDGAGGIDTAIVIFDVVLNSNFLTPNNLFLVGFEDSPTPLNLSVEPSLEFGGTLQDILGVAALYRAESNIGVPVASTIPVGTTGINITGYGTRNVGTSQIDNQNDDYELLSINVDLRESTYSGRLTYSVSPNEGDGTIDQYTWLDVPLGQSVLSDTSYVSGNWTGDADPLVELVAGQLRITETIPLQIAYHVEYMTADGDSADFVSAAGDVQTRNDTLSTFSIPPELEPTDGSKKGYLVLTGNSAADGTHFAEEHKGFSRLVVDLEAGSVSGVIASERGELDSLTTTWSFTDYPLVDLRETPGSTPVTITDSTATRVGDSTAANTSVENDPIIYIDTAGELIIERATDHAAAFTTMFTAEYYLRTGFSSIASFVGVESDTSLFDSTPADGVDAQGKPVNLQTFSIPESSAIGVVQMSWQTIGGSQTNENVGYGFAVIDINANTSSGSITFSRATTPDLLAWQSVPLGTTMFGAMNGGTALYQSNKSAGSFTDGYAETARFTIVDNSDGSRTLELTATSNAGTGTFADYIGTTQVSWLGSEPFAVNGVPATGTLSFGAPTSSGEWEVDFPDIPQLAITTSEHETGEFEMELLLSSTGESDQIVVHVQPVVDAPTLIASEAVGYINNSFPLNIVVGDSADIDGSETQLQTLALSGVPTSITLSASTGTVDNFGGGSWQVSRAAINSLTATGSLESSATITVSGTNTDTHDLDGDNVIEDGNNGSGVDELDSAVYTDTFELTIDAIPTVISQITNTGTPSIQGTASIGVGEVLSVTVNGVEYIAGDGDLVVNPDDTWQLIIPNGNSLTEGTYTVIASVNNSSGNSGIDATNDELFIDLTSPPIPTVASQITTDDTPNIVGTATVGPNEFLTVTVDGMTYNAGDSNLVDNGDGTWALAIPTPLAATLYNVTVAVTDPAGNSSIDVTNDELQIDPPPLATPTVDALITTNTTPTMTGTAVVGSTDTLTVTLDGVTYAVGDGNLVFNSSGTWILTIPTAMVDGTYEVIATVTDMSGNAYPDTSSDELVIDTTEPVIPTVSSQTTNNLSPVISGTASLAVGETLRVIVDGTTYLAGDGSLIDNGDGTWDLVISTLLPENTYNVIVTVTDEVGNTATDTTSNELIIDITAPGMPTVVFQTTGDSTPLITGTASVKADEFLTVNVSGNSYTAGDGNLVLNPDNTWALSISNALPDGTYSVTAKVTDAAGNSIEDATAQELNVDTLPPVTPTVQSQNTNAINPLITGTATLATNDILTVSVDGTTYTAGDGHLVDNGNGTWALSIPVALAENAYDVVASVTDPAGNATSDTTASELFIDLTAPVAPGVTSQSTTDTTPLIEGTATLAPGEILSVEVNGFTYTAGDGDLIDNGDGTWALTIPATSILFEGLYQVIASVTDAAGNSAFDPGLDDLLVDLTAPHAPGVTSLTTNDTTPLIEGTATLLPGETLSISVNGVTYLAGDGNLVDNADGTWALTVPVAIVEDSYDVLATITDSAGNLSIDPSANELLIDTTLPLTPSTLPLFTNDSTPVVSGTANPGPGEVLTVTVNGTSYSVNDGYLTNNGDGTWSLSIPIPLVEGTYDVMASVTDAAGNVSTDTGTNELVIDLTSPIAPTVTSLTTNTNTPTLSGTVFSAVGETLTVTINGITYTEGDGDLLVNADGTWNLTIPSGNPITDGNYAVTATTTDLVGNSTDDTSSNELIVDTAPPVIPTVDSLNTNITTPSITGTAAVAVGETLTVTLDGIVHTAGDGNLVNNADGTWVLNVPNPLADETYSINVTVTDIAGNASDDLTITELVIDTAAPTVPTVTALTTSNSTPSVSGTATVGSGESLTVTVDGTVYTADDGLLTLHVNGTWGLSIPTALSDGNFEVTATVTDLAGNSTDDATTLELTIDTIAPSTPTVTPQTTNDSTPELSGTATVGSNETISVTVASTTYIEGDGFLVNNADGTWTLILPTALAEDTYEVTVSVVDAAGNSSADTSANELIIDITPPATPTVIVQATNQTSPTMTGTATVAIGDMLTVTVDGATYTAGDGYLTDNGNGTWTLSLPVALAEGAYEVTAAVTDPAGNSSSDLTSTELIIDITAPVAPGVTSQTTNNASPIIEGTATVAAGEVLTVVVNNISYTAGAGDLVVHGDGTWTLTLPASNVLAEILYQVVATVTDPAGNSSTDPGVDDLLIDLTAPNTPGVTSQTTNNATPVIVGTATPAAGETLSVTVNGLTYNAGDGNLFDNADGTWSLTIPSALIEALYDVTATITDSAGNLSTDPSSGELLIDTTAPTTPTAVPLVTNNTTPVLSGAANPGPGETLRVMIDGITYIAGDGSLVDNGDGTWSLSLSTPLAEGTYEVTATVTDAAGNVSIDSGSNELVIDLTVPIAPTVNTLITNDNTPIVSGTTSTVAGESLSVSVNGINYIPSDGNLAVNPDGTWNLSIPTVHLLADGIYDVVATSTDLASNSIIDRSTADLTVDTQPPVIPTVIAQNTSNTTPTLAGTATLTPGESLTVTVDGVTYLEGAGNLVNNGDGTWELTLLNPLADASYPVTVTVVDTAGNSSDDITTAELIIDTTDPATPGVIALTTSNTSPTLSGTATVTPDETLTVMVNGVVYTASDGNLVDNGDGTWDLALPVAHAEGTYDVTATVSDLAGNVSHDTTAAELLIDTTSPISPTITALTTNNVTPVISGTAVVGVSELLTVVVNGITYTAGDGNLVLNNDGTWNLNIPAALTEDQYNVTASVTDEAGNTSSDASVDELIIDLTVPVAPTVTALSTNSNTPVLSGTTSTVIGEILTITVNGLTYTADDGNLIVNTDGTWALTIPVSNAIASGNYEVIAAITDAAGNESVDTSSTELFIDSIAPATPTVNAKTTNNTIPTISGTAMLDGTDVLTVQVNGTVYTMGDGYLAIDSDGNWMLSVPTPLPEGTYPVYANVADALGNESMDVTANELTIDTTSPVAPGVVSLITSNTQPIIKGTATLASGDTLTVQVDGVTYRTGDGHLVDNGDSTWTLSIPDNHALAENLHQVIATVTDVAGNAATDPGMDDLLIDITAPNAPGVASLVTNSPIPLIEGIATLAVGESLSVVVNGATYTPGDGNLVINSNGTWALTIPQPLLDGSYDVSAVITDSAGNFNSDPSSSELLIDTTVPASATTLPLLTNNPTPLISGTVTFVAGETLSVTVDGVTYTDGDGYLAVNADGTWTLTIPTPLTEGSFDIIATVTDAAGNVSSDDTSGELVIDLTAPTMPVAHDQTTENSTPVLSGIAILAPGEALSVTFNGRVYTTADENLEINENGTWSLAITEPLTKGRYDIVATITDAAANISASDPAQLVILADDIVSDFDGDGIPDEIDLDDDNDGIPDVAEGLFDTDSDGRGNHQDLDSDNDGIADIVEVMGDDVDADYFVDNFIDSDNNGLSDDLQIFPYVLVDTDQDLIADFLDLDSDNDGLTDRLESSGIDTDHNGVIDNFSDENEDGIDDNVQMNRPTDLDTDADGIPNRLDLDTDGDELFDLLESGGSTQFNSGVLDSMHDSDFDGIPDSVDVDETGGEDLDNDSIDDRFDVSNVMELDTDSDGIIDSADPDVNGDGYADFHVNNLTLGDALPDSDGDGVPDLFDPAEVPSVAEANETPIILTGLRGSGCTVSRGYAGNTTIDPLFSLLIATSALALRRRKRIVKTIQCRH